jgi:hypothetical protein
MLIIGTVYSWAMFALIVGLGWGLATTTWAYAIVNFFLTTVGVVGGGFWLDRQGPRRVAMTDVALWGPATCSPDSARPRLRNAGHDGSSEDAKARCAQI